MTILRPSSAQKAVFVIVALFTNFVVEIIVKVVTSSFEISAIDSSPSS